jgi:hypothetical protein
MMRSKSRKTKTNLTGLEQGYVVAEAVCGRRVVASVAMEIAESVVAVVMAESVVAVVMTVTRT